ncbi:MAG: hypothetical protein FK731_13060, partial [Asgard group archaeon]|nr:hypothetical protein [Asgard group archaeon]
AIELLNQNTKGFFLMIEGGRIDQGSHDNNIINAILETISFNLAVIEAKNYVDNNPNTILIVTADHETGGLSYNNDNLDNNLPSTIYSEEENRTLRISRINQLDVSWGSSGHTRKYVPFFAYGNAFENITDVSLIDNIDIFSVMNDYIQGKNIELINRLQINKTSLKIVIPIVILSHITIITIIVTRITISSKKVN